MATKKFVLSKRLFPFIPEKNYSEKSKNWRSSEKIRRSDFFVSKISMMTVQKDLLETNGSYKDLKLICPESQGLKKSFKILMITNTTTTSHVIAVTYFLHYRDELVSPMYRDWLLVEHRFFTAIFIFLLKIKSYRSRNFFRNLDFKKWV